MSGGFLLERNVIWLVSLRNNTEHFICQATTLKTNVIAVQLSIVSEEVVIKICTLSVHKNIYEVI